jgi:hypothetical protein
LQECLYRPEVESLPANGSGQKFIGRGYRATGADLHHGLKKARTESVQGTLCRRNFYVAFTHDVRLARHAYHVTHSGNMRFYQIANNRLLVFF